MPWSWDSDTESDTDPRLSCGGGAVGTQVDSSAVPSELLDAMERDCEPSHSGPHNADVTAPGPSMLVSTQVDSNDEFASQFAEDDFGSRNHGGVAVFADVSQPRLKRLRLVSRGAPVQSELHVADCATRVEPVPSRRVVLVPGSPDDTPRSIQDRSASNRFSVLAESDAEDGQPQHHDIGTPPPTADEGDNENNDRQLPSWEGPRTGVGSVIGEDVIPEGEEFSQQGRWNMFGHPEVQIMHTRGLRTLSATSQTQRAWSLRLQVRGPVGMKRKSCQAWSL